MASNQRGRLRVGRHGQGWMAAGPDFYVWDEDGDEVQRVATALLAVPRPAVHANPAPSPTRDSESRRRG